MGLLVHPQLVAIGAGRPWQAEGFALNRHDLIKIGHLHPIKIDGCHSGPLSLIDEAVASQLTHAPSHNSRTVAVREIIGEAGSIVNVGESSPCSSWRQHEHRLERRQHAGQELVRPPGFGVDRFRRVARGEGLDDTGTVEALVT